MPQKTIGAFYVVRALGGGGASSVFVARRIEERKNAKAQGFALKVPAYDPTTARSLSEQEFLQLFREEAGALLSLPQHVNLARFVTFDLAARPKPILVMELIGGLGLDRLIRSRSLSSEQAFKILDGILAGVEAMHGASVGHLDLKPSNVILRDGDRPVLVDFGLSGRKLRPGCGTLDYCSPEVLGHRPADYVPSPLPADIYAFACMAYETLTGELLFEAEDETAILSLHVMHDGWPDRLAAIRSNSGIPGSGDGARGLLAAGSAQASHRPPSAHRAGQGLQELARPPVATFSGSSSSRALGLNASLGARRRARRSRSSRSAVTRAARPRCTSLPVPSRASTSNFDRSRATPSTWCCPANGAS